MNRLTKMTEKGAALVMADHYETQDEAKADLSAKCRKAFEKLFQYESLELEPEEIYSLLQLTASIRIWLNKQVTWKSPHKDKSYKATLGTVKNVHSRKKLSVMERVTMTLTNGLIRRYQNEQFKQNDKPRNSDKRNEQKAEKTFSSVEKAG